MGTTETLRALLDGRFPETRDRVRWWLSEPGNEPIDDLSTEEHRERVLAWARELASEGDTGIGYPVELVLGPETVILDFPKRAVRERIPDEKVRYGFAIAPELVRTVLRDGEPDWVNTIFLSTRFRAWRVGGYNEYLYTFFKCLTDERITYADGWFAEAHDDTSDVVLDGWTVQRRCPHLKADLSKFGVVEGSTLTCNLHGWQWNLENGRCLTTNGHELRCSRQ